MASAAWRNFSLMAGELGRMGPRERHILAESNRQSGKRIQAAFSRNVVSRAPLNQNG
jgi:hypothetical protein